MQEISFLHKGLDALSPAGAPALLADMEKVGRRPLGLKGKDWQPMVHKWINSFQWMLIEIGVLLLSRCCCGSLHLETNFLHTWHDLISLDTPHSLDRHILFNLINQMFAVAFAVSHVMSDALCHKRAMLRWPVTQELIHYADTFCCKL